MLRDASLVPLKGLMHLHLGAGTFWPLFIGEGLPMSSACCSLDPWGPLPLEFYIRTSTSHAARKGDPLTHTRSLAAVAKENIAARARRADLKMVVSEV